MPFRNLIEFILFLEYITYLKILTTSRRIHQYDLVYEECKRIVFLTLTKDTLHDAMEILYCLEI